MFTREQINELLKPWGSSLDERPTPSKDYFAYEESDRKRAWDMANYWQEKHIGVMMSTDVLQDFICHQSDVIEMLAHALNFANKRLMNDEQ